MKKNIMNLSIIVFITVLTIGQVSGQWINCGSKLLRDSLFESKLVDTVKFGENTTPGGKFKELYMHIYEPVGDTSTYRPALVLAFGGAYIKGDKEDVKPICDMFASRGYVCAAIDYRLFDAFKLPDSTVILDIGLKAREDMIAAIKYLRWNVDNGNKWKINPDYIFVGGASSGAITALSVAYFNEKDSVDMEDWMKPVLEDNGGFEGKSTLPFAEGYNYNVSGVANMLGAVVDLDYIDEGEPLVVSIHGTDDDVVPYGEGDIKLLNIPVFRLYGSSLVHNKALEEGIHSSFISVEGGGHGGFLKDQNLPWLDSMVNTTINDFYNFALCPENSDLTEEVNGFSFDIYPNPAVDYLRISSTGKDDKMLDVEVFTIDGDKVKEFKNINIKDALDIKDLGKGLYLLKIIDAKKHLFSQKAFIVHRTE